MSGTFSRIRKLVVAGRVRISVHGFERMQEQGIKVTELVADIDSAEVLEDYPDYHSGPTVLVLHPATTIGPVHAVWGMEKGTDSPAVLVTAYRPDPDRWSDDYRTRKVAGER